MRLQSLLAVRYLFSRKSFSVMNVMSAVSSLAVAVPVMAMVVLLSVFNGFVSIVGDIYSFSDSDITVTPAKGKVFLCDSVDFAALRAVDGVREVSAVLEEKVIADWQGARQVATVRGVDSLYASVIPVDRGMVDGEYSLLFGQREMAVVGRGLAYRLGVTTSVGSPLRIYTSSRGSISSLLPASALRSGELHPSGIFSIQQEIDDSSIICRIEYLRKVLSYPSRATSLEIAMESGARERQVVQSLEDVLSPSFTVRTRFQKNETVYRVMRYEKWGVFLIAFLVLVVASFSVTGTLVMLIIEKRKDISVLYAMGAERDFVRGVFRREGMLIGLIGIAVGLAAGIGLCLAQQAWGMVRLNAQTFMVDAYPVAMSAADLVGVAVCSVAVNLIIITFTVRKMIAAPSAPEC